MGIVIQNLSDFIPEDDGSRHQIELNEGDEVHIHIENLRLSMSQKEFNQFSATLTKAVDRLDEVKMNGDRIK